MSERLTKRLANGGVMYDSGEYWRVCYPWNEHCLNSIDRMAIKLCDLEDKIEQMDMVEVVRCEDCMFGQRNGSGELIGHYICEYDQDGCLKHPRHYCNSGERSENET